ncbi:MAG: hypothetical protein JWQ38_249 [Flavipsychrobacter sp.]|nr:hypothetical protein [Flavipsychrobacter sp.]
MKKILLPMALLALLFTSCKKDNYSPTGTNTTFKTYTSIDEVFSSLSLQPKVVTFDAAAGSSFYGNSGTRYTFRPNCFADAAGNVVTGNVQVEVTEWTKKGDMIFSGMLPVSYGEALVSGGELEVKATKNGTEIFPRKYYGGFQANIPQGKTADSAMEMFRGQTLQGSNASKVNWQITKRVDSGFNSRYMSYYKDTIAIICDSFKQWNCDHFMGSADLQTFKVNLTAAGKTVTDATQMYSYALFETENTLLMLKSADNGVYSINYLPKMSMRFVSFGLINGHFYGGVSIVASPAITGSTYTVPLTEVDPKDFKSQINGLY